jgi:hypothetical protein
MLTTRLPLPSGRAARNGTPSPRPCLPAPNPSHFPKSRGFPFVSNYYPYWPPADHLLLSLRLLAPRTVEHEDFRQPAEMRDRLDELHRLSAVGTQGRSRCIGQHKRRLCRLRRGTLILIKVERLHRGVLWAPKNTKGRAKGHLALRAAVSPHPEGAEVGSPESCLA